MSTCITRSLPTPCTRRGEDITIEAVKPRLIELTKRMGAAKRRRNPPGMREATYANPAATSEEDFLKAATATPDELICIVPRANLKTNQGDLSHQTHYRQDTRRKATLEKLGLPPPTAQTPLSKSDVSGLIGLGASEELLYTLRRILLKHGFINSPIRPCLGEIRQELQQLADELKVSCAVLCCVFSPTPCH